MKLHFFFEIAVEFLAMNQQMELSREVKQPFHSHLYSLHRAPCLCALHHSPDGRNHQLELRNLFPKLLPSRRSQRVIARPAIRLCLLPFGFHPSLQQKPLQRRIERAFLHRQYIVRKPFDRLRYAVAVQRRARQSFQNQHVEGSRKEFRSFSHALIYRLSMDRKSMAITLLSCTKMCTVFMEIGLFLVLNGANFELSGSILRGNPTTAHVL